MGFVGDMMNYYFCDWEIRDDKGKHIKWANSIIEVGKGKTPPDVFRDVKESIYKDLGLPENYLVRAITFARI